MQGSFEQLFTDNTSPSSVGDPLHQTTEDSWKQHHNKIDKVHYICQ